MEQTITQTLIQAGVVRKLEMPKYFYQGFFKHQFLSTTDLIVFDDVTEDFRGLAKFVAPNVVTRVNQTTNYDVKSFRPAYVKEKDVIEAWSDNLQARVAGEEIGGKFTPQQRAQMMRAKQLRMHRIKVENLIEYMCFKALVEAQIEISSEEYPKTTVDYYRDSALTLAALGGKAWSVTGVNPLDSIATMTDLVYDKGIAEVDTLIMGRSAWALFHAYMTDKNRLYLFDQNIRGSDLEMNLIFAGGVRGVERVATFTGLGGHRYEIYVDNRAYLDSYGRPKRYVGDTEVIGVDSNTFNGVQAFGAIKDADVNFIATRMAHKEFRQDDPSADYLLTQSAPLPIVMNPNSTFRILNVTA